MVFQPAGSEVGADGSEPEMTPLSVAVARATSFRSHLVTVASVRFALARFAFSRSDPESTALVKLTPARSREVSFTFLRTARDRLAFGPTRYPSSTDQPFGNEIVVPTSAPLEIPVSVAVLRSALVTVAWESTAPVRFPWASEALVSLALANIASDRLTYPPITEVRSAPVSVALVSTAFVSVAPVSVAPARFADDRAALVR